MCDDRNPGTTEITNIDNADGTIELPAAGPVPPGGYPDSRFADDPDRTPADPTVGQRFEDRPDEDFDEAAIERPDTVRVDDVTDAVLAEADNVDDDVTPPDATVGAAGYPTASGRGTGAWR